MPMKNIMQEDRRLVMLRALKEMDGYEANESILDQCLEAYGHNISRDLVKTELSWLQEQGLIKTRDVGGCIVATLTGRGEDAVKGAVTIPGVKRPRPGA